MKSDYKGNQNGIKPIFQLLSTISLFHLLSKYINNHTLNYFYNKIYSWLVLRFVDCYKSLEELFFIWWKYLFFVIVVNFPVWWYIKQKWALKIRDLNSVLYFPNRYMFLFFFLFERKKKTCLNEMFHEIFLKNASPARFRYYNSYSWLIPSHILCF